MRWVRPQSPMGHKGTLKKCEQLDFSNFPGGGGRVMPPHPPRRSRLRRSHSPMQNPVCGPVGHSRFPALSACHVSRNRIFLFFFSVAYVCRDCSL